MKTVNLSALYSNEKNLNIFLLKLPRNTSTHKLSKNSDDCVNNGTPLLRSKDCVIIIIKLYLQMLFMWELKNIFEKSDGLTVEHHRLYS